MALLWAGFFLGCAFGAAARLGRFCLLRGLREQLDSARRAGGGAPALQAFALALAVALLASQALAFIGAIDLAQAQVVRPSFSVISVLLGGLLFGVGMALARNCGARALVLLAGGNLRALVALLCLGLAAQATLTGVLAPVRQSMQGWGAVELAQASLPHWLAAQGLPLWIATMGAGLLPALALAAYALRGARGNVAALLC